MINDTRYDDEDILAVTNQLRSDEESLSTTIQILHVNSTSKKLMEHGRQLMILKIKMY